MKRYAIALVLVAALGTAPGAFAAGGRTSQGERATVKRANGKIEVALPWRADCRDGGGAFRGTVSAPKGLRLHRKRFGVFERGRERAADDAVVDYRARLRGRVRGKVVKGTWRLIVIGSYSDVGAFTCDTGVVRFTSPARRRAAKKPSAAAAKAKLLSLKLESPGRRVVPGHPGRPPAPPATPTPPAQPPLPGDGLPDGARGQVLFHARLCNGAGTTLTPLAGAKVFFEDPSGAYTGPTTAAADGSFTMATRPPGQGPVSVAVELDSDRIKVTPDGLGSPYRIEIGLFPVDETTFQIPDGPASAVSNTFVILNELAAAADATSPAPPPKITALSRWGPNLRDWMADAGTFATLAQHTISVGGKSDGSTQDAWERWVLAHEYAHHVMSSLTGVPASAAGEHDAFIAYPEHPELAYSEGFAWFFPALVYGPNQPRSRAGGGGCAAYADLSTKPATGWPTGSPASLPQAPQQQWAQYDEVNIGAALYQAAQAIDPDDVQRGGNEIMEALLRQHQVYGGPSQMREARDALSDFVPALRDEEVEQAVGDVLADQGIAYGFALRMDPPFLPPPTCGEGCAIDPRVEARIIGPGGVECDLQHGFANGRDTSFTVSAYPAFKGPLPTRHDDCYVVSAFGHAPGGGWGVGVTHLFWDLPFLDANGHRDKTWTVEARLTSCGYGFTSCPFPVEVPVHLGTGHWFRPGESPLARPPRQERLVTARFNQIGVWLPVATIGTNGACTTHGEADGLDCGVGR